MNKQNHLLLGAALLLAPLASTQAQSTWPWQTVDGYIAGPSGTAFGLAAVDNGIVFSARSAAPDPAGIAHAYVRRSLDGGQTWELVSDLPGNGTATSLAVAVGHYSGLVFATAIIRNAQNLTRDDWVTLRSADGGTTWSKVDVLTPPNFKAYPYAVVEDPAGRVFVGGWFSDTANRDHYLVRRSLNGGTTWTTVEDLVGPYAGGDLATGMAATPAGVFSVGRIASVWSVRRSTNGGTTWTTVDTYQSVPGRTYMSWPKGIAADTNGSLYVTGTAEFLINKAIQNRWITRKSTDNGATWRTVDSFLPGSSPDPRAVTVDAIGRVFVTGSYTVGSGTTSTQHWIARASVDGGVTWTTTDDLVGFGMSAASDAVGNVYIGGRALGDSTTPSATVRKLGAH
jgi:hypothetical protein